MGIIDLIGRGVARLAGSARVLEEAGQIGSQVAKPKNFAIKLLETGYNHPVGRFAVGSVEDTGFGMLFGASPLEAGASAVTGRAGAFAGSALGHRLGGEAGQNIGEFVGGAAGQIGGMYVPQALGLDAGNQPTEQMGNPDSAQQDPQQVQQQMMSQLTPDQIQKLQEQAARKAAQAQYQAAAMQQYGGSQQ